MKKSVILVSIILSFLLQGCYTTQSVSTRDKEKELDDMMNSWKGETKNALLLKWGSPTSVTSDGAGGEILTFKELKRAYSDRMGYITVVHKYMIYVNKENIIYHWKYERRGRQGY